MAGHPSVKKRQKEMARKERQAEKLSKRDERRTRRNAPPGEGEVLVDGEVLPGDSPDAEAPNAELPNVKPPGAEAPDAKSSLA